VRRRHAGFTLIEVLVALAIVVVGMAAVLEALSSSANTVLYLRDKTLAQWVGLNQIATTRLGLQPGQVPPTGNTTGDLDYAGRSWHWRQEVTTTQIAGIVRIDVDVRPADVKAAGDDRGWFTTVSGIAGDALAPSQGVTPMWGNGGMPGQCPPGTPGCETQQQCPPNTPGCNAQQCPPGTPNCNAQQQCQPGQPNCTNSTTPAQPCQPGSLGCNPQSPTNSMPGISGPGISNPPAPAPAPAPAPPPGEQPGDIGSTNQ